MNTISREKLGDYLTRLSDTLLEARKGTEDATYERMSGGMKIIERIRRDVESGAMDHVPVSPQRRARRSDPITSHNAASGGPGDSKLRQDIIRVLTAHGPLTDDEIRARLQAEGSTLRSNPRRRRSELLQAGVVFDTGEKRLSDLGSFAIVWAITKETP